MEKENIQEESILNDNMDFVSDEIKAEIEKTIKRIREEKKAKRIYPIAVQGDEFDDKEVYVAYFKQPDFITFSKYLTISQKQDGSVAMRQLAKDCFIEGDRSLIDDDSLFIYGTFPYLSVLIQTRRGGLVNFSKSGK